MNSKNPVSNTQGRRSRRQRAESDRHAAPATTPSSSGIPWVLIAVVAGAALVRLVYLVQYARRIPYFEVPIVDAAYYDSWAQRVASGQGYGPSPFYLSPLYPYGLALIYAVIGHQPAVIYVAQLFLGLASLLMVYLLGRKLFGHRAGTAATLLMALYLPIVIVETKLLSETLAIALTLAALLLLVRLLDRPKPLGWLLAGVVLGLSVVCRSSNLLFAVLLLAWLGWQAIRTRGGAELKAMGLLTLALAAVIAPVTIRNTAVGNDFVLIQSNAGMTLAQGNNEKAAGVISHPPGTSAGIASQQAEEMAIAAQALGRPVKPSESSAYWTRFALAWMRDHPRSAAMLLCRKLLYSINNREELDSYETYYEIAQLPVLRVLIVPFSLIAGLAVLGLVWGCREQPRAARLLGLYVLSVLATLVVFYVGSRYRMMAVPVLAVLAGRGLVGVVGSLRDRAPAGVAVAAVVLAATTAVAQMPYPIAKSTGATTLITVAAHHQEAGRTDKAIEVLRGALRASPQSPELHSELGLALARRGDFADAVAEYRIALQTRPDIAQLHLNMANALEKLNQYAEADRHWEEALRLAPNSAEPCVNRGAALFARGMRDEAIKYFRLAVARAPASATAHNNLGAGLAQTRQLQEALACFREALRLDPDYLRARGSLSVALAELGQSDEAVANLREGLRRAPGAAPLRFDLARLLASLGRTEDAVAEYRELLRVDPRNTQARRQLDALLSGQPPPQQLPR